jgi:hypothetical protein
MNLSSAVGWSVCCAIGSVVWTKWRWSWKDISQFKKFWCHTFAICLTERQAFKAIRTCTPINSRSLNPVNRRFRFKVALSLFLTLQIHEAQKSLKYRNINFDSIWRLISQPKYQITALAILVSIIAAFSVSETPTTPVPSVLKILAIANSQ